MSCGPGCVVLPTREEIENFAEGERVSETRILALIDALDTLRGPLCRDPECPDYDGEHPYHSSAVVRAHEAGQKKVREVAERAQVDLGNQLVEYRKLLAELDELRAKVTAFEEQRKLEEALVPRILGRSRGQLGSALQVCLEQRDAAEKDRDERIALASRYAGEIHTLRTENGTLRTALAKAAVVLVPDSKVHDAERLIKARLQRDEAQARADTAERKQASMAEELTEAFAKLDHANRALAVVGTPAEDVWKWQGEGDDPQSLSCPVVMSADTLRGLAARAVPPGAEVERLKRELAQARADTAEKALEDERERCARVATEILKEVEQQLIKWAESKASTTVLGRAFAAAKTPAERVAALSGTERKLAAMPAERRIKEETSMERGWTVEYALRVVRQALRRERCSGCATSEGLVATATASGHLCTRCAMTSCASARPPSIAATKGEPDDDHEPEEEWSALNQAWYPKAAPVATFPAPTLFEAAPPRPVARAAWPPGAQCCEGEFSDGLVRHSANCGAEEIAALKAELAQETNTRLDLEADLTNFGLSMDDGVLEAVRALRAEWPNVPFTPEGLKQFRADAARVRDELADAEARALSTADAATLRAGCHHTQACLNQPRDSVCSCGCAAAVAVLTGKVLPDGEL